jgi:prevent-host-death family protein
MKTIAAAKFKEQCLALLDSVTDEGLIITKRGKPVARLLPVHANGKRLIGVLRGKLKVRGNLLSTGIPWDADPDLDPFAGAL